MKKLYIVTHEFRNGSAQYPFYTDKDHSLIMALYSKGLADLLGIPFDPMGREEYLIIDGPNDVETIQNI